MKRIFQFFLIILGLFAVLSASAQRINPTTQIKRATGQDTILVSEADGDFVYKPITYLQSLIPTITQGDGAPGDDPGDNQSWIYVDTTDDGAVYFFDGTNWLGPVSFLIQGNGAPTDPPGNNQSWFYVDYDNEILYYWDGDSWEIMDVTDKTYANGLTETGDTIVRWGGDLTAATIINSKGLRNVTFDSIPSFFVRSRTGGASTATTTLWVSNSSASGFNTSSYLLSDLSQYGQIAVRANVSSYLRQLNAGYGGETRVTPIGARIISQTVSGETVTDQNAVIVDTSGTYMTALPEKISAATKILWYNNSTEEVFEGTTLDVIKFDSLTTGVYVQYTGTTVSAIRSAGSVTITVPATARILSARVTGADADNAGSGHLTVTFTGNGIDGNYSVASMRVPAVQKIDLSAQSGGAPGTGNPYPYDDDDTAQVQVVGVGNTTTHSIAIRTTGLTSNYNNYQLIFNF